MSGFAMLAPFVAVGIVALTAIAITLRNALPMIAQLRTEVAECQENRAYSFRIREVVSTWNDGTVVALPVRVRQRPLQAGSMRAAA